MRVDHIRCQDQEGSARAVFEMQLIASKRPARRQNFCPLPYFLILSLSNSILFLILNAIFEVDYCNDFEQLEEHLLQWSAMQGVV